MYTVYIHRNKINNKAYIGLTKNSLNDRAGPTGHRYKHSKHFYNAIQKYGWDSFEHIIFMDNLSQKKAKQIEFLLIKLFNTLDENYGYNLKDGGDSPNPKTKKAVIKYDIKGNEIDRYDSCTEAAKSIGIKSPGRIGEVCRKERLTVNNYIFRFINNPLTKQELQELINRKEIASHSSTKYNSKRVYEVDINTKQILNIYNSLSEAGRLSDTSYTAILNDSKRITMKGFQRNRRHTIFILEEKYEQLKHMLI